MNVSWLHIFSIIHDSLSNMSALRRKPAEFTQLCKSFAYPHSDNLEEKSFISFSHVHFIHSFTLHNLPFFKGNYKHVISHENLFYSSNCLFNLLNIPLNNWCVLSVWAALIDMNWSKALLRVCSPSPAVSLLLSSLVAFHTTRQGDGQRWPSCMAKRWPSWRWTILS